MAAYLMFVLPTYTLICIWKLYYSSFCESFAAPLKPKSETSAGHIVWGQRILIIHNEMQFENYFIGKIASHGVLKMKGSFGWPKVEKVYSFSQLTHIVAYLCGHEQDKCGGGMATTPGTHTHVEQILLPCISFLCWLVSQFPPSAQRKKCLFSVLQQHK